MCLLLDLIIAILGIKEHKYQFQFPSNQVREVSYMTPLAHGAVRLISMPLMHRLRFIGFLIPWAVSDLGQLFYLLHLNAALFRQSGLHACAVRIDRRPVDLLLGMSAFGTIAVGWPVLHLKEFRIPLQLGFATITTAVMLAISYKLFRVDEMRLLLWDRVASRFLLRKRGEANY